MQGQALANQVSTLRESAEVGAAELENLQKQQDKDAAAAADLKRQLEDAEEEIAVLRLQAERAAILEVQSEISSRLVEDLQARSELADGNYFGILISSCILLCCRTVVLVLC